MRSFVTTLGQGILLLVIGAVLQVGYQQYLGAKHYRYAERGRQAPASHQAEQKIERPNPVEISVRPEEESEEEKAAPDAEVLYASIDSGCADFAGSWGSFGPGFGRLNSSPIDWHVRIEIRTSKPLFLNAIHVVNRSTLTPERGPGFRYPEEAWTTSNRQMFGKELYPIVVRNGEAQINHTRTKQLTMLDRGQHQLDLYLQKESTQFNGEATLEFGEFEIAVPLKNVDANSPIEEKRRAFDLFCQEPDDFAAQRRNLRQGE
jgi:hypothetical protein